LVGALAIVILFARAKKDAHTCDNKKEKNGVFHASLKMILKQSGPEAKTLQKYIFYFKEYI
jgi:hypothetical protein